MQFEFATATRIVFGDGVVSKLPDLVAPLGTRCLVVTGANPSRFASSVAVLRSRGIEVTTFATRGEPTVDTAREGVTRAREGGCDVIVAIGGGSVVDAGKAIAALIGNGGDPLDYLEVIGAGKEITKPSIPFVAVPTTAGTGSEVTRNAVLAAEGHRVKVSLRSPLMLPRVALVDPVLTHTMPPAVTASTGLDALTQVIEPFVSSKSNPLTDGICREGMGRAARSLRLAYQRGDDAEARRDMALASLFGGLALANAALGAVHGLAAPAGGMFSAPHGALCARLLPFVMERNVAALRARSPNSPVLPRFDEVARILTGRPDASAEDGIAWVMGICDELAVPHLGAHGLVEAHFDTLVDKAAAASSMKGNPIALTRDELLEIVQRAL
ncbi:MAG: iron-containing alcohol dehydrogenase [Candidatus Binatia bacterium]|jgi:alcohol dehydrogenase class IV